MSEQRDGLSRHEVAAAIYAGGGAVNPDAVERVLALVVRREAAAAAEAVEKALGPVSELADELAGLGVVSIYESAIEIGEHIRAAIARGREEAGTSTEKGTE